MYRRVYGLPFVYWMHESDKVVYYYRNTIWESVLNGSFKTMQRLLENIILEVAIHDTSCLVYTLNVLSLQLHLLIASERLV